MQALYPGRNWNLEMLVFKHSETEELQTPFPPNLPPPPSTPANPYACVSFWHKVSPADTPCNSHDNLLLTKAGKDISVPKSTNETLKACFVVKCILCLWRIRSLCLLNRPQTKEMNKRGHSISFVCVALALTAKLNFNILKKVYWSV